MVRRIAYTIALTEWRNKFRRLMNEKDNEATNKAVDSLINFETVKYFCNERKEAHRFETAIDGTCWAGCV
jgi:ATP-binding cassette subfamily B protein